MRSHLSGLSGKRYDVAVIGGGINGTATAARLSRRGYDVVLIDQGDFGSGSSSRSSRHLHCGLATLSYAKDAKGLGKKLEYVVGARQMLRFRAEALRDFPEKIKPREFFIPVFAEDKLPNWQFDMAFGLLSLLSGFKAELGYRRHDPKRRSVPILRHFRPGLTSATSFVDMIYDVPERLCVDLALDAESAGADIRNYTRLVAGQPTGGGWQLTLADSFSPEEIVEVSARMVLNLTGVWSDGVNARLASPKGVTVTPNKGCHIAVRLPDEFADRGIMRRNAVGHVFMCSPWRGLHVIGPTETPYTGSLDSVAPNDDDVESLLHEANSLMPGLKLSKRDIVFKWAGLRPASFEAGNPRGAWTREFHDLSPRPEAPALGLSWGRISHHADTADRLVGMVVRKLGPAPRKGDLRALRKKSEPEDLTNIIATEYPMTVADVLFRRTGHGWDSDLGLSRAQEVAAALAARRGRASAAALVTEYTDFLRDQMGFGVYPNNTTANSAVLN
jgi:glycerol-3-phosphate dehydrogenase